MPWNYTRVVILFLLFLFFSLSAQASEILKIDHQHSYVLWRIKHFNFSTQSGKWYVEGTLELDKDKPQNSKVNVSIFVANMVTGIAELDKHLKSKLFFDVKQFPFVTFVSNKVEVTGKKTAKVYGTLTVHGVEKPVILDVKLNHVGVSPITEKMTVGFSANTKLKRSNFGINTLLPGLGDEVKIDIEVEAYKENVS
jgi:polyisoprenoid-binding protein YceI